MRYPFLILLLLILSCKDDTKTTISKESIQKKAVVVKEIDTNFTISVKKKKLHREAKKIVEDWQEYQAISEFIPKFYKTSTKEALLNSAQLYELTTYLKDSIRIKNFDKPSFKIRLNVLNNEALRLFDMDSIPSITNPEVIHETKNIINAFNALNTKINNEVKRDLLVKDLSEFDGIFESENMDTIKPINKSLKKTKLKKPKRLLKNKRIKPLTNKKKKLIRK